MKCPNEKCEYVDEFEGDDGTVFGHRGKFFTLTHAAMVQEPEPHSKYWAVEKLIFGCPNCGTLFMEDAPDEL